jgi:protein-L-isoaspartate(D-aspartate) O-methyltransferase
MVQKQIAARGITDISVLEAMSRIPRHLFIEESQRFRAYDDMALPIGDGQTISQPYIVSKMTELLSLKGDEKVLEIGTGSGYQTALLAELSREVFTVERYKKLLDKSEGILRGLGYKNIHFTVGDGTLGLPDEAPFDRILVTAATPDLPDPLVEQLGKGGIIVAPVGDRLSQVLTKGIKKDGSLKRESHTPCVFVPLVGDYGFKSY